MMDAALEDLSYDYEEDGVLVRKQLDRAVLTRGAWAAVMFLYQELDRASGAYRPPRMAVVRFRKARGGYRKQGAFNVDSQEQAQQLAGVLARWSPRMSETAEPEADREDDRDHDHDHHDGGGRAGYED